ncbi:NAD(P)-dependent oxidoreductase [Companilactobacillus nantensis]|uniref:NADH-flavin reductase n=1 Tax=Companilactobacillus nantensis DSM 16982 TaxID=1423774 RepID=A0A0R1WIY6_9LACO|nr:NAD(P)H-binding protein [Companilactobacillus nantensis]KRM17549.1 NADH-flavin reductase [Companilactobacillus nantensis DSM 16982]GEO64845.1 dihydrodipicolinate reductase [Companilactobacillus nantensis]
MKVAVIGANGKEGSLIVKEALNRDLDVTSIVRDAKKSPTDKYLVRDVYSLQADDIKDFDVLVDALGFFGPAVKEYVPATQHLIEIIGDSKTRLLVVGGAGSLYLDENHTKQLYQQADFPEAVKPLSEEMGKSLDILRDSNIDWTFISPAADFQATAKRTGKYVLAGEELTFDANGKSEISYADFAIAMVDEIVEAKHSRERISVRW